MVREISACRACGNASLTLVLDLGEMALSGTFPRDPRAHLTRGPLQLVRCDARGSASACGLVQLRQSYDADEMYGQNYGYRSSLNRSMIAHLAGIAEAMKRRVSLGAGDLVLDIGSNDGTLLSCYEPGGPLLVGMDPTIAKFGGYYRADVQAIPEFFSAASFRARFGARKAKVVTSIAMFYDLESPVSFMEQVREILADDGVWHTEQSYLPAMLARNSYDTVCHEHLEYYALEQLVFMAQRAGLTVLDVSMNDVNGGSFAVTLARAGSSFSKSPALAEALAAERALELGEAPIYDAFRRRIEERKATLLARLDEIVRSGKSVLGYGASTKGNVLLQYCGIGPDRIPCIAEVNADKFGCFTPGTGIPIVAEAEARALAPDFFLVLPWHFRDGIVAKERAFLDAGGALLFPLPEVDVVLR